MWALRRSSVPLRSLGFNVRASRACSVKLTPTTFVEDETDISESPQTTCGRFLSLKTFYHTGHSSLKFIGIRRELFSLVGRSNKEEGGLEDGVSELDTTAEEIHDNNGKDELISEQDPALSDEERQHELELSETEIDATEKRSTRRWAESELFKAIIKAPGSSVHYALEKWVEEGRELSRPVISLAMTNFRRRRMYGRALQFSEWLEENKKQIDFIEKNYASQLDLIAKVRGLHKAEQYIESIPKSFRGEAIYQTLLSNCVSQNNVKKAEEIFNKIKNLELPVTAYSCNQLLLLYKRNDRRKIADVLLLMEEKNVKPSLDTYKILIDPKGQPNDIAELDKIVEKMTVEGIEPDNVVMGLLARNYASAGLKEKAEAVLKKMEGEKLEANRSVCQLLLPRYANLEKADEVKRIWKVCESNPRIGECLAAIEAWGKLKKVEEAEAVFEMMVNKWKKLPSRHYAALLKIYADNKMLTKGKDLIKRIGDTGCRMGPITWDALVKLYIQAGEVEKADSVLQKMIQENQMKPLFSTYMAILDQYARRGDIHNSEKIFLGMRQFGYTPRLRQYQALTQAYINAKLPAYGIRERMKADNIIPNNDLASQLVQADAFRSTADSDLLG